MFQLSLALDQCSPCSPKRGPQKWGLLPKPTEVGRMTSGCHLGGNSGVAGGGSVRVGYVGPILWLFWPPGTPEQGYCELLLPSWVKLELITLNNATGVKCPCMTSVYLNFINCPLTTYAYVSWHACISPKLKHWSSAYRVPQRKHPHSIVLYG